MIAVDLFAGLGGNSEGARAAGYHVAWAANHFPPAVLWHSHNHAETDHSCQDLQQANWLQVPSHDTLLASPCCQGHCHARGNDTPQHDVSRSTAWAVVSCAEAHRPATIVVENVPEFLGWVLYPAWHAALTALGYTIAPFILDAADFGVPQHRVRIFLVCTRSRVPFDLQFTSRDRVPFSSAMDRSSSTWSPIRSKCTNTRRRAANGRTAQGHRFVMPYYSSGSGTTGRSLDRPLGTITTKDRWAVVDGEMMRMISVEETRRVMGFPDSYLLPTSSTLARQLLGNAVCPPVVTDILTQLRHRL